MLSFALSFYVPRIALYRFLFIFRIRFVSLSMRYDKVFDVHGQDRRKRSGMDFQLRMADATSWNRITIYVYSVRFDGYTYTRETYDFGVVEFRARLKWNQNGYCGK
jgi:hypothetical protein